MATKKSRTSNKKSNDKQKKLLALVLVVLFIGLGVLLVVSSYAARGGKSKPGGITQFVTSPYGISAVGGTQGWTDNPSTITITDRLTGLPLASIDGLEQNGFGINGQCYQNRVLVGSYSFIPESVSKSVGNASLEWTSGGANCIANLVIMRDSAWVVTASTTYTVAP